MSRPTHAELRDLKEKLIFLIEISTNLSEDLTSYDQQFSTAVSTIDANLNEAEAKIRAIEEYRAISEEEQIAISEIKDLAQNTYKKITELSNFSDEIEEKIEIQSFTLNDLTQQNIELKKTVESLLPGATSAGLASAFKERKDSYLWPKRVWSFVFIASVLSLLLVATYNPVTLTTETLDHTNVFSFLLGRLPFVLPIVWLAIYAGRRHNQTLRLEEDYAHKEVISKSFEGYKKQLLELEGESSEMNSTKQLINETLRALAFHPERIYNGKHHDITPLQHLKEIIPQKDNKD